MRFTFMENLVRPTRDPHSCPALLSLPFTNGLTTTSADARVIKIALWTEGEVREALRDMSKGKWGRQSPRRVGGGADDSHAVRPGMSSPTLEAATGKHDHNDDGPANGESRPETRETIGIACDSRVGAHRTRNQAMECWNYQDRDGCCVQAVVRSSVPLTSPMVERSVNFSKGKSQTQSGAPIFGGGVSPARYTAPSSILASRSQSDGKPSQDDFDKRLVRAARHECPPAPEIKCAGPIFYRTAWERSCARVRVWKLASRSARKQRVAEINS